jgi:hypothetical protein
MNNQIDLPKLKSKIYHKMIKLSKKSEFLEQDKVVDMHPEYLFSNVGLMLLIGKMGSSKTNDVLKHLLIIVTLEANETRFYFNFI